MQFLMTVKRTLTCVCAIFTNFAHLARGSNETGVGLSDSAKTVETGNIRAADADSEIGIIEESLHSKITPIQIPVARELSFIPGVALNFELTENQNLNKDFGFTSPQISSMQNIFSFSSHSGAPLAHSDTKSNLLILNNQKILYLQEDGSQEPATSQSFSDMTGNPSPVFSEFQRPDMIQNFTTFLLLKDSLLLEDGCEKRHMCADLKFDSSLNSENGVNFLLASSPDFEETTIKIVFKAGSWYTPSNDPDLAFLVFSKLYTFAFMCFSAPMFFENEENSFKYYYGDDKVYFVISYKNLQYIDFLNDIAELIFELSYAEILCKDFGKLEDFEDFRKKFLYINNLKRQRDKFYFDALTQNDDKRSFDSENPNVQSNKFLKFQNQFYNNKTIFVSISGNAKIDDLKKIGIDFSKKVIKADKSLLSEIHEKPRFKEEMINDCKTVNRVLEELNNANSSLETDVQKKPNETKLIFKIHLPLSFECFERCPPEYLCYLLNCKTENEFLQIIEFKKRINKIESEVSTYNGSFVLTICIDLTDYGKIYYQSIIEEVIKSITNHVVNAVFFEKFKLFYIEKVSTWPYFTEFYHQISLNYPNESFENFKNFPSKLNFTTDCFDELKKQFIDIDNRLVWLENINYKTVDPHNKKPPFEPQLQSG